MTCSDRSSHVMICNDCNDRSHRGMTCNDRSGHVMTRNDMSAIFKPRKALRHKSHFSFKIN